MSMIDELASKLRGAQRASKKAKREYDDASANAHDRRAAWHVCEARVEELQRALSLLRNGLKAPVPKIGGNVTPLRK